MYKHAYFLLALAWFPAARAEGPAPVTDGPVIVYRAQAEFEAAKEALKSAIANQGLLVSGTLHIQDMLTRTGKDLGFAEPVFLQAESTEFCSALLSHKMVQASPLNSAICPFTVAVYEKAAEPGQVYYAFRKPLLAGEQAETVALEVENLLHTIVREAVGGGW